MIRPSLRTTFWVGCYVALAVGPLAVLAWSAGELPSRGFWIEFSSAMGFIALAMFALQFVLTARFKGVAAPHGLDTIIQFHREAGLVAVGFALLHPIVMILTEPAYLEYVDVRVAPGRAVMLLAAVAAMLLIVFLTFGRQRLRISYEWWRLTHGVIGVFIVVVALIHVMQVAWYVAEPWQRGVWISLTIAALLLLGHVRIGKPLAMRRHPFRVVEVRREGNRAWIVAVEPVGHAGMRFKAGQFAWLTLGPTAFSLQQHPFSFASSATRSDRVEFAIRELGDFTSTIGNVRIGETAFLEGPYGAFTPNLEEKHGLVLIAGGVGIAPMMCILRTLRDLKDVRPVFLIYANRTREDIMFENELRTMSATMNLSLVFVLDEPTPGMPCEHGRITNDLLNRQLPQTRRTDFHYLVCGPDALMDIVEAYLSGVGIPPSRIHTERFNIA